MKVSLKQLVKKKFEETRNRKEFIKHLRDSAERLKIWSLLLSRQANELEETGYTDTVCYYPEERQF